MTNIHPLIVHFPIALIIVAAICDLAGIILGKRSFIRSATIMSVFAAIGAIVAVISGTIAEETVWHPQAAHEMLETHETIGFIFLGLIIIIVIFRLAIGDRIYGRLKWIALVLVLIASGIVGYGGLLGGELVYTHGTGVREARIKNMEIDSLKNEINILKGEELSAESELTPEEHEGHEHAH